MLKKKRSKKKKKEKNPLHQMYLLKSVILATWEAIRKTVA
jgi:hypothetical protein